MSGKRPPEVVPEDPPGGDGETGSGKACGLVPWEPWEGAWGGGRDLAGAWQPGSSLLSLAFSPETCTGKTRKQGRQTEKKKERNKREKKKSASKSSYWRWGGQSRVQNFRLGVFPQPRNW